MSAHKKQSVANHTIMVDDETFYLVEKLRQKKESKGEALKRIILTLRGKRQEVK